MKSFLKRCLLPEGRELRRIRGGVARGLVMQIDLKSQLQRYLGLDERELVPYVRRLLDCCTSLFDIGANDGYYTLAFLRSKAMRVVACEPGSVSKRLLENVAANDYSSGGRFHLEQRLVGNGQNEVKIAELVKDIEGPILLKVDIDGGEFCLLQSAEASSRLQELHWIVETHSPELERLCFDWFIAHGYQARVIPNAWWRFLVPEVRPLELNRWLLALPKPDL
jgi:hypothetical protein